MLKESIWFVGSLEGACKGLYHSLEEHFGSINTVTQDIPGRAPEFILPSYGPENLLIAFVEYPYLHELSACCRKNLSSDHYILIAFSEHKIPFSSDIGNIFDIIPLYSSDFDMSFFLYKLQKEIQSRSTLSLLQSEVKEFYEIGKSLSSEKDTMRLFDMIINSSISLTSSDAGTLYLIVDKDTGKWSSIEGDQYGSKLLKFAIAKNQSMDIHLEASVSPITKKSIFGYTVITGKPLRIENAYNINTDADYRHDASYNASTGYTTKSILSIPMKGHQNNIIGVIQLINKKKTRDEKLDFTSPKVMEQIVPYDAADELIMNSIAGQAAVALENILLYQGMQDLLEDYKEKNIQLSFLSRKVLKAHEEERKRIAREIHDGPAQSSANLALMLEIGRKYLQYGQYDKLGAHLNELGTNIRSTVKEIRGIIYDLKPSYLEDGLFSALKNHTAVFMENTGIPIHFQADGDDTQLEYYLASTIYRITQEALSNIHKHANAQQVTVDFIISPKVVLLSISDDGKGFDTDLVKKQKPRLDGGFGLQGIQERVELIKGSIEIASSPGKGTQIGIRIPISE